MVYLASQDPVADLAKQVAALAARIGSGGGTVGPAGPAGPAGTAGATGAAGPNPPLVVLTATTFTVADNTQVLIKTITVAGTGQIQILGSGQLIGV